MIRPNYAEAIAFSVLLAGCVLLEIFAKGANSLWVLVAIWVLFGTFSIKNKEQNQ